MSSKSVSIQRQIRSVRMRMSVSASASVSAMNIHEYYAIIKGKTPSVVSSSSSIQAAQTLEFQPPHSALRTPHSPLPSLPCQERRGPVGSASASAGWVSGRVSLVLLEFISAFQSLVRRACCFSCLH